MPIYRNIHSKRQHFSLVVVGKPGSGKSYLSIYIAWLFYPEIDVRKSVVYSAGELAQLVSENLPKGFPIIIDDAGLTVGSVDAMTKEVKSIGKILQSIRSRNLVIIVNLPNFFLLAKNVRTLIDYYAEPTKVNREQEICHAKFRILKINPLSGVVYRYSPVTLEKSEHWTGYTKLSKVKRTTLAFAKAPNEILDAYEKYKSEKMLSFNKKQSKMLNLDKDKNRNMMVKKISEEIVANPEAFKVEGEFNTIKIATTYDVSKSIASDALELIGLKKKPKMKKNPYGPGFIPKQEIIGDKT